MGEPCYEIVGKTTGKPRPVNLADARKQSLFPSVTTVLGILDKPALTDWKIEQAVLAVLTSPRQPGEADDAFAHRILHVEKVQDQERDAAADRGSRLHEALHLFLSGQADQVAPADLPWIESAAQAVLRYGEYVTSEKVLVGEGYGGRTDLVLDATECWWLTDWKCSKKLPERRPWDEHIVQAAAYAAAWARTNDSKPVRTLNCYVSTTTQGSFVIFEHDPCWLNVYVQAWKPLLQVWGWLNDYIPQ